MNAAKVNKPLEKTIKKISDKKPVTKAEIKIVAKAITEAPKTTTNKILVAKKEVAKVTPKQAVVIKEVKKEVSKAKATLAKDIKAVVNKTVTVKTVAITPTIKAEVKKVVNTDNKINLPDQLRTDKSPYENIPKISKPTEKKVAKVVSTIPVKKGTGLTSDLMKQCSNKITKVIKS